MKNTNRYMTEDELIAAGFPAKPVNHNPVTGEHCAFTWFTSVFHSTVNHVNHYVPDKHEHSGVVTYVGDGILCFKCDRTKKEMSFNLNAPSTTIKLI